MMYPDLPHLLQQAILWHILISCKKVSMIVPCLLKPSFGEDQNVPHDKNYTLSSLVIEVPFDPFLPWIFMGEEIIMSTRLWTAGYDIFAPSQSVVGHMYNRPHQPKFWETVCLLAVLVFCECLHCDYKSSCKKDSFSVHFSRLGVTFHLRCILPYKCWCLNVSSSNLGIPKPQRT